MSIRLGVISSYNRYSSIDYIYQKREDHILKHIKESYENGDIDSLYQAINQRYITMLCHKLSSFKDLSIDFLKKIDNKAELQKKKASKFHKGKTFKKDDEPGEFMEMSLQEFRQFAEFTKLNNGFYDAYQCLPNSFISLLISIFDEHYTDLIHLMRIIVPHFKDKFFPSKKKSINIDLDVIIDKESIESLVDQIYESELNSIMMKKNRNEIIVEVAKLASININQQSERYQAFNEIWARRNIAVHNSGVVNNIYTDSLSKCGINIDKQIIGTKLKIDVEYLEKAINTTLYCCLDITSKILIKYLDQKNTYSLLRELDQVFDDLFNKRDFDGALIILDLIKDLTLTKTDNDCSIDFSYALVYKKLKNTDEMNKYIDKYNFNDLDTLGKFVHSILKENHDNMFFFMEELKKENFDYSLYFSLPIFREIFDKKKFRRNFMELYGGTKGTTVILKTSSLED